jgi:hypothetical protein
MAQKRSDFSAIPLCFVHHRINPNSYHRLIVWKKSVSYRRSSWTCRNSLVRLNNRFRRLVLDQLEEGHKTTLYSQSR